MVYCGAYNKREIQPKIIETKKGKRYLRKMRM